MAAFISCVAMRCRFPDMKAILQRSALYAATLATIALLFFGTEFVVEKWFYSDDEIVDIAAAVIGAFVFSWLRNFFEKITDRIFFKGQYDYGDAVFELSTLLGAAIELRGLLDNVTNFIEHTIKPVAAVFLLTEDDSASSGALVSGRSPSLKGFDSGTFSLRYTEFAEHLLFVSDAKAVAQIISDPDARGRWQALVSDAAQARFAAVIPVAFRGHMSALLFLGEKKSGSRLSSRDKALLAILSRQTGVAIETAKLYEDVRRHAEEFEGQVALRTERIKTMYEAQSAFLTEISHEFQTPIAILKMNLTAYGGKGGSMARQACYVMETTLDRLSRLTEGLLDIARLNFSKEKFGKTKVCVGELLREARDDCLLLAEDKGIKLSCVIQAEPVVSGDRDKLKEMLLNLVSNALKHTPPGGSVSLSARDADGEVEVAVADSGTGIAAESIPQLFERFYRIGGDARRGNGLGLYLCRRIVEAHGGTITVESKPGEGSRFIVHLPRG